METKPLTTSTNLQKQTKDLNRRGNNLGTQFQLLIDGPLEGLLNILNRINFKAKKDDELTPQELKVRKLEQRNRSFASTITPAEKQELTDARAALEASQKATRAGGTGDQPDTKAEEALIDLLDKKKDIEKAINADKLAALQQALTARRDELAILNTAAGITRAVAELDNTRTELAAERNAKVKDTYKITQLEKSEIEQSAELERQRVAQANALALAQLQIWKDQTNAIIATSKVDNEIYQIKLKSQALNESAAQQTQTKLTAIRQEAKSQEEVLRAKFEVRKLDIKELEVKIQEAMLLEAKVEKIKEELALKEKQIRQAEALRIIGVNQFQQQQDLNDLLAEQNALRSIQANSPERTLDFASAGLGFFGDSAKLEADLFQKYNDDIDVFNEKIKAAKRNIQDLTDAEIKDGRATPFYKEIITLDNALDRYKRLQPAINAAAIEQQQFNDALAAVTPGVNALVGGLQEVVAGTKTAEEAFADFLKTVADQLIQTAATMIAQYIAIGLAKAFAGLSGNPGSGGGGGFNPSAPSITGNSLSNFGGGRALFAEGGYVTSPTSAVVGEGGEPEYIIPASKMDGAMQRYSTGAKGAAVIDGPSSSGGGTAVADAPAQITINGGITQMGGEDYIKKEELPSIISQAGKAGETRALRRLQMSSSTRNRVGI